MNAIRYVLVAAGAAALVALPSAAAEPSKPAMPANHPPMASPALKPAPRLAPATVLARAGAITVTAADADAAIDAFGAPDRFEFAAPEALRDLVEGLVDRKLMAREARSAGMDDPKEPKADRELALAWLERELARVPAPTEAAIARYYRDNPAEFRIPRRVLVTRGIATSEAAATRLRGELARGASVEELRGAKLPGVRGIESLWLQDAPKPSALTAAALGLKKGEVSGVLPVEAGFAVLRAEELAPAAERPLADVRAGIAARLEAAAREQATSDARARLRKNVAIEMNEAALMSYSPPPAGGSTGPAR